MSEPRFIIRDDNDRVVSVPESRVRLKSQIIRPDAPIGAPTAVFRREDPPKEPDSALMSMTRDELNAHASSVGIENPEGYANKTSLIEAIEAESDDEDA